MNALIFVACYLGSAWITYVIAHAVEPQETSTDKLKMAIAWPFMLLLLLVVAAVYFGELLGDWLNKTVKRMKK